MFHHPAWALDNHRGCLIPSQPHLAVSRPTRITLYKEMLAYNYDLSVKICLLGQLRGILIVKILVALEVGLHYAQLVGIEVSPNRHFRITIAEMFPSIRFRLGTAGLHVVVAVGRVVFGYVLVAVAAKDQGKAGTD